jgi:hypothetical protein
MTYCIFPKIRPRPNSAPAKGQKNEKWELIAFLLNNIFQKRQLKKSAYGRILGKILLEITSKFDFYDRCTTKTTYLRLKT